MSRGRQISKILTPLSNNPLQVYVGTDLHTLGLLGWILGQTGTANVYVSTFSTSEEFLDGFYNLNKKGLLKHTVLLADLKASRKTAKLKPLMANCFDAVYLGQNHSKIVLVQNDTCLVSVISSQNQTYGGRNECTMISTSQDVFLSLYCGFKNITNESVLLDDIHRRTTEQDRGVCDSVQQPGGDFRPFGVEW